jgi:dolichyl-phosphate-mannose--protein O-mannosyl transferase
MLQKQLHGPVRQARDSSAWTWPLLLHPIRYYPGHLAGFNGSTTRWIVAVGNPVFFGTFLLALPLALVNAIRRADPAARLALSFYAAMYLPWLFFSRAAFIYYIVPCLPFMALAIVSALRSLGPTIGRRVTALVLVADVGAAAAFMPVWLGLPGASSVMRALHLLPGWPR